MYTTVNHTLNFVPDNVIATEREEFLRTKAELDQKAECQVIRAGDDRQEALALLHRQVPARNRLSRLRFQPITRISRRIR